MDQDCQFLGYHKDDGTDDPCPLILRKAGLKWLLRKSFDCK